VFTRVLFTSASTVRAYFGNYPDETTADRTWLAVGPSTLKAIEAMGLDGDLLEG
jgi:uroporphyrinogen-III synthase